MIDALKRTTQWIRSEDLMHNMVTMVEKTVLYKKFAMRVELKH